MKIGLRIKEERIRNNLSQEEVAKAIGTTKQAIYKYECGIVTNIPTDKIAKMANLFGVTPSYLMGWENTNHGINNGIIGNHNSNNVVGCGSLGEIERELISICAKLDMKRKTALLTKAYELMDEE